MQAYEALAVQEAIESGITGSELAAILNGIRVTELFPPHTGEPTADYATRATSEIMVRYLAQADDDTVPPD